MSRTYPPIEKNDDAYTDIMRFLGPKQCRQIRDMSVTQISQRWMKADVWDFDIDDRDTPIKRNGDEPATRRQRFRIPLDSVLARRSPL